MLADVIGLEKLASVAGILYIFDTAANLIGLSTAGKNNLSKQGTAPNFFLLRPFV